MDASPWRREGLALVRAATGGLLFGIPLLYTIEVWSIGSHTSPAQMLLILALLFVTLLVLNATAGFREARDIAFVEAVEDSVLAIAVGIVATWVVLVLLRQITAETSLVAALGRIVNECIPFCLGVGVARFLVQGDPGLAEDDRELEDAGDTDEAALKGSVGDIGATVLGASFVGLSIAPTDEVAVVAAGLRPAWLVLVVVLSLTISYCVVFVAGFSGQDRRHAQTGVFQHPATETLVTYVVALLVAAVLLWAFQRDLTPPFDLLTRVVVLGLPAAIGGAVGRLAL